MVIKPEVCLLEADTKVIYGWQQILKPQVTVTAFPDHLALLRALDANPYLAHSWHCVVVGKYFPHLNLDLATNFHAAENLRHRLPTPMFLNWQGYVPKDFLSHYFDGKIFQRYGVKWHTLRLRIQRTRKQFPNKFVTPTHVSTIKHAGSARLLASKAKGESPSRAWLVQARQKRCLELLRQMAANAQGEHRRKIEFYANQDPAAGIQLLEALYNRLLITRERSDTCPSRYIATSPVIAVRILEDALT